ncbi:hypothetical protein SFRURICE_016662, partial [Spodoptera frugiperda]
MTFALGLNMRFISSLCFGEEFRYSANSLCINKGLHVKSTSVRFWTPRLPCSWTPVRNWPCIVILLRNRFKDNYEIKRIFSPRVNVIRIR